MTTHAVKPYTLESYQDGDCLIFGSETSGVTEEIHEKLKEFSLRIPMRAISNARCLNLSNSAAVVLYEALRQNNFLNLM